MSNYKVRTYLDPGLTVYALLFNSSGNCWDGASFSNFAGSNDGFDISLTEDTDRTMYYSSDLGQELTRDVYQEEYWQKSGASPDRSADTLIGTCRRPWVWTREFMEASLPYSKSPSTYKYTYTLTDSGGNPVKNAYVWICPSSSGDVVLESGTTDVSGQHIFHLPAGTYYVFHHKDNTDISPNPEQISIAETSHVSDNLTISTGFNRSGENLYALLFNPEGRCWDGMSFSNFDGVNSNFDITLSEGGNRTSVYSGSIAYGNLDWGEYEIEIWWQQGGSPNRTADEFLGIEVVEWMGDHELDETYLKFGKTQGTVQHNYTATDENGEIIPDTRVMVTADSSGNKRIAEGTTAYDGVVSFFLESGTYYFHPMKAGQNTSWPDQETV